MNKKETIAEIIIILLASLVLAISSSFNKKEIFLSTTICFLIILLANTLVKKAVGYFLEIDVKTKLWSWYQYGLKKSAHFKAPVPMIWLPLVLSAISFGYINWLAVLEFDVSPRTERVSRRHGLYRFTEVTEWHLAWIAVIGIFANLALAIIGYLAGFETFTKLSIMYATWSLLPLSKLDGAKIFFGSRQLWTTITTITLLLFIWSLMIV